MPASPIRRRPALVAVSALFALGLLAGCAGQQEPDSYTGGVENSFIEGCWQQTVLDDEANATKVEELRDLEVGTDSLEAPLEEAVGSDAVAKAKAFCGCAFDAIEKDVEFSEFKKVTDDLRDEDGPLPAEFTAAYDGCETELS